MQGITRTLFHRCQGALAVIDDGSKQETSVGRSPVGLLLLLLLLAGIGLLVFISVQDLMRGALIDTPGLCIWV
jgi:hypothetical protein